MQQIKNWLAGDKNYLQGVALYVQYGESTFFKKLFSNGRTDYNADKLEKLLTELTGVPGSPSTITHAEEKEKPIVIPEQTAISKKAENERYLRLIKQKGDLYTTLNLLMTKRHHLPDGEELRSCAVDILKTNQKLTECWALIDHYQEFGEFPVVSALVVENPKDKATEMQYLRQSISKCRKRLENSTCRNKEATQKLLAEQENRLALLSHKNKKQ